jgi:acetyl-CoA carboxylase, biotin carboxylase subunit
MWHPTPCTCRLPLVEATRFVVLITVASAIQVADEIGFPVMIKATAGGGGRGMRLAERKEDFLRLLRAAQGEAQAAFGNGACYIERYVVNPRHIEFQVLCDKHGNVVHLGERDCSIQRRNQKLVEEAPSPALTPKVRLPSPFLLLLFSSVSCF